MFPQKIFLFLGQSFNVKFFGEIARALGEGAILYMTLYGLMILFFSYFRSDVSSEDFLVPRPKLQCEVLWGDRARIGRRGYSVYDALRADDPLLLVFPI